jgi:hypothetical protein
MIGGIELDGFLKGLLRLGEAAEPEQGFHSSSHCEA